MKKILGVIMAGMVVGGLAGCASKSEVPVVPDNAGVIQETVVPIQRPVAQAPVHDGTYSYQCELGKKVTVVYKKEERDLITLRWNNKNHVLTRAATTTGANRFEDKQAGLVWINIPAKGILLDSKKGRQLANECKS